MTGDFPEPHLSIDCYPADPRLNPIFAAVSAAKLQPLQLAFHSKRVSEERSRQVMAEIYADTVIAGSPNDGFDEFETPEWTRFLLENPDHFDYLRSVCPVVKNFDPNNVRPAGAADDGDVSESGSAA